ncbi:hypothetical protein GCM10010319_09990 [Streptomyces blastmyceticus]|uniref:Type II toxin-antitoxin system RelE/ParE family toxin n=1 Tax=Streptomyces blastmyceticus TaxID=68180 RepID=A0ABP3G6L6_9ACTN
MTYTVIWTPRATAGFRELKARDGSDALKPVRTVGYGRTGRSGESSQARWPVASMLRPKRSIWGRPWSIHHW